MQYFLPTYKEAKQICDAHENFIFFETLHNVDGYNISIFAYRLSPKNFDNPIPDNDTINAYENRGLTFIFNKDGSLFKRYLLMNKFFNINQVERTAYHNISDLTIKNVMNKEDGSVISFIKLPNGNIYAKSKASFSSFQAVASTTLLNNNHKDIYSFVDYCLNRDINPIFEYVSPYNEIVLKYKEEDLILLKIRCNVTGKYLNIEQVLNEYENETNKKVLFKTAEFFTDLTLDDLLNKAETETNKEGWIVEFEENDKVDLIKIKTNWYFYQHSITYSMVNRENIIIRMILDETIDDALALELNDELRAYINQIIEIVDKHINDSLNYIKDSVLDIKDKYDLYLKNKGFKYIKTLMLYFSNRDEDLLLFNIQKEFRKEIFRLNNAIYFLQNKGIEIKKFVN